jgi:predicted NAD/FAD-dependent oxidoreductase
VINKPRVGVIGAGIAGIACAATLRDRGISVRVFDKSRGVGGRMATRRVSPWQWDHGMQYMVGDTPEFQQLLEPLPTWRSASAEPWYVGTPSQNQLVKNLAEGIELSLHTRIAGIAQSKDQRWVLEAEDSSLLNPYNAIAIATPAPQAHDLLPQSSFSAQLSQVAMTPCWALMVASPEQVELPTTLESPHQHIAWFAADHSKPGRPAGHGQYVLHATVEWSERHLEDSNEAVQAILLDCFREIAGDIGISYAIAHRWRYAFTKTPLAQSCLIDTTNRIGLCGDWCLGSRVEHGFLSGVALGKALAECL